MKEFKVEGFTQIKAIEVAGENAKLLASDRQTIIDKLNAKLTSDGAGDGKLFGLPVEISAGIPQGEVWMINANTGELIAKLENVGE